MAAESAARLLESRAQPERCRDRITRPLRGRVIMLWTIAIILLVLWALGLVTSYTLGGFIHILIVAAVILVLVRLIQGRRVV
jgi:fatty acid desaturase